MLRLTLCVALFAMATVVAQESQEYPKLRVLVAKRRQQRVMLNRLYTNPDQLQSRWDPIAHAYAFPGEMSYFSAYNRSHGGFNKRITVCNYFLSSLITEGEDCSSLDESATTDFVFYVSDAKVAGTQMISYKVCLDRTTNISYSVILNQRMAECRLYSTVVLAGQFYAFPGKLFCRPPDMLRSDRAVVVNKIYEDEVRLQSLTFECNHGYVVHNPTITCDVNGKWLPRQTRCQAVSCGRPAIQYGSLVGHIFSFPYSISYTCNDGYVLSPSNATIQCQADGQWSGTFGECKPVSCGPPEPVAHGRYIGSNFTYGSHLDSVCDEGYRDYHKPEVKCTSDGTWKGSTSNCIIIRCMSPDTPRHGVVLGHSFQYGKKAWFTCYGGYTLVGHSEVTCGRRLDMSTPTGAWIGFIPSCQPSD